MTGKVVLVNLPGTCVHGRRGRVVEQMLAKRGHRAVWKIELSPALVFDKESGGFKSSEELDLVHELNLNSSEFREA